MAMLAYQRVPPLWFLLLLVGCWTLSSNPPDQGDVNLSTEVGDVPLRNWRSIEFTNNSPNNFRSIEKNSKQITPTNSPTKKKQEDAHLLPDQSLKFGWFLWAKFQQSWLPFMAKMAKQLQLSPCSHGNQSSHPHCGGVATWKVRRSYFMYHLKLRLIHPTPPNKVEVKMIFSQRLTKSEGLPRNRPVFYGITAKITFDYYISCFKTS